MDYSLARAAASGIGSAAVLGAVAFVCASVSGYHERLTQTLCALALGGAIVIFVTTFLRYLLVVSLVLCGPFARRLPYIDVLELGELSALSAHSYGMSSYSLPCFGDPSVRACLLPLQLRFRSCWSSIFGFRLHSSPCSGVDGQRNRFPGFISGCGRRAPSRITRFCTVTLPLGSGAMSGSRNE